MKERKNTMFTDKATWTKLARLTSLKKRVVCLALLIFAAISAFAGLDLTAYAANGSPIKVKVTVSFEGFEEPDTDYEPQTVYVHYYYDYVTSLGHSSGGDRTDYFSLSKEADGTYTAAGNLNELVSNTRKSCYASLYYKGTRFSSETVQYMDGNTVLNVTVTIRPDSFVTPNWNCGKIYSFDEPDSYPSCVGEVHRKDKVLDYCGRVVLYANGGSVANPVGTKDNYKSKQLTLWETFEGDDDGTYNSTTSRQIAWIVTKDDKCPAEMKQKSDLSVVKVSKTGKISAIAPGTAYVWACRVDPNNPSKVSTTESAHVKVTVYDAPTKVVLTQRLPIGEEAVVPLKSLDLGIGEKKKIYLYMESKINVLDHSKWKIEVTKGSEYVGISATGREDTFTDHVTNTIKGQNNYFYIKADNMNMDGKMSKATVTITNLYTGKNVKLNVNVNNCVVSTTQPVRGDEAFSELFASSPLARTSYVVPNNILSDYYKTSAQQNLVKTDDAGNEVIPKEYETLIHSFTTDKPKIYVTSDETVTKDMIFSETKNGLTVKFTGVRSNSVSASWQSGYLKVDIKKNAAAEKGNIILVFNTSHGENGYLVIPYQVTSASLDSIS